MEKLKESKQSEIICDNCSSYMTEIKRSKKNSYSKCNTVYKCENCGNQFRKRTTNEVLRDLGYRQ